MGSYSRDIIEAEVELKRERSGREVAHLDIVYTNARCNLTYCINHTLILEDH